jgi:hypothetical protein
MFECDENLRKFYEPHACTSWWVSEYYYVCSIVLQVLNGKTQWNMSVDPGSYCCRPGVILLLLRMTIPGSDDAYMNHYRVGSLIFWCTNKWSPRSNLPFYVLQYVHLPFPRFVLSMIISFKFGFISMSRIDDWLAQFSLTIVNKRWPKTIFISFPCLVFDPKPDLLSIDCIW